MIWVVVPAKAGTQYPSAFKCHRRSCGVLDARVRGHDDSNLT
jgi:hypothetical protein